MILKQLCLCLLADVINFNVPKKKTVAETIYGDIENNEYLIELYNELLRAYTRNCSIVKILFLALKNENDLLSLLIFCLNQQVQKRVINKVWIIRLYIRGKTLIHEIKDTLL